ncbi:MAG: DUF1638 domain-containing protein [Anaerolineae bacterium]|nr:DUF1638 domain-containing protein [Anaerolineae bacterium]
MRLKCLGCEVLARPLYLCAAQSPHIVDIQLLRRGLHNTPPDLRAQLQHHIDTAAGENYDAVVLAYGLCGQATAGLVARDTPVVMPRAHDCITIYLGSRQRYQEQFENHKGTYWYTLDYMERRDEHDRSSLALGSGLEVDLTAVYDEYVEKYGQDNADYLMEVMGAWQQHYQRAAYVDLGVGNGREIEAQAQADAARRGWIFERVAGDLVLIRRLVGGDWETDFLVLQPGQKLTMTYDDNIIGCVLANGQPKE